MENVQILEDEGYKSKGGKGFKKIFKNFSLLTIGKISGDFFTFILFVVLSRKFGQEGVGQYSFGVGLGGFFSVCADFGLYSYTIKEISRDKNSFSSYFQKIFSLRIILSIAAISLLIMIVPFLSFSLETKAIIIIITIYQIIYSSIDGISAVFIAHEYMHISAGIETSLKIITSLAAISVALLGGSIVITLLTLPVLAFIQLFAVNLFLRKRIGKSRISFSSNALKETFRHAVPYGTSEFFYMLNARVDIVLIGLLLGESFAGLYNVGYRIVFFFLFIPKFASITLFPIVSTLYCESKLEFKKMYNKSLNMMIIIGLPLSAVLYLIAPGFIELIFGSKFYESSVVLRILSGLFLLTCISYTMEVFLMASDNQKARARGQSIATFASVALTFVLILTLQIEGAAVAVMISSLLLVTIFAWMLKPVTGLPEVKSRLTISLLGVSIFSVVFLIIPASIFIIIPGAVLIYITTILLFKSIRENELRMALELVRERRR
jgi:O-antigen/teichoic acid export membrane protein